MRLPGWRETPLRRLDGVAAELGLAGVALKDESDRLGLPAFKVLGASWAVERALREAPDTRTLVAASAGNHGRAVAHVAGMRGLRARIFVPARAAADRRAAIEARAPRSSSWTATTRRRSVAPSEAGAAPEALAIADVGDSGPAHWVIDGYHTLFAEAAAQASFDALLVPAGVGSLAAAAARFGALAGGRVIAVEPETAACVTASLAAGEPAVVPTPGHPHGRDGLRRGLPRRLALPARRASPARVTVCDAEAVAAMRELAALGYAIGDCGAAPLAALRALMAEPDGAELRAAAGLDRRERARAARGDRGGHRPVLRRVATPPRGLRTRRGPRPGSARARRRRRRP